MNIEEINKAIQNENENYNKSLNRLKQEMLNLKLRHQRSIANLQSQKEQAKKHNENYNHSIDELNRKLKQLFEMC